MIENDVRLVEPVWRLINTGLQPGVFGAAGGFNRFRGFGRARLDSVETADDIEFNFTPG